MRPINPEKVAPWLDPYKLKAWFMFHGYENYAAPLAKILFVKEKTARSKMSESRFDHEETIEIARSLGLSEHEYCQIFVKNLYGDKEGTLD